jgi:signal transduction histidine kinase
MNPKGRVLLVGGDALLLNEMTPSMVGREYELAVAANVRDAALKLSTETFAAVVADFAKVPPPDREALALLQRERGGFALFGLEAAASLSPATASSVRRLPWPLPKGFLDQVRAVEVPVLFLVEPALFLTQGIQNALRQAGVQFFQIEAVVGLIEMMREQQVLADEARAKSKPPKSGFWGRFAGTTPEAQEDGGPAVLGHVAVMKFMGVAGEAAQIDARVRQALPNTACYLVTAIDPLRAAVIAVTNGQPAVLPRESAVRVAEILNDGLTAVKSAPREKERLLLVDNDVPVLSRIAETLIALGFDVVTTINGEEALKLAGQKPFQLAAIGGSALETTKLSGANLALKLRERDKDLRIILMVDQFPVQDALKGVSRAVELGLDDAILKPIDASRLVLSIQRALERRFLIIENARLLREVQDSARKLAQVNGFQTKFFATVAHDVKNPLTAILGYAEVLSMRLKAQPDELKCAAHIHNAARTLNLLVSDLVDLAAIESGKLRVEIGALDLAAAINDVKSRVDVVAQRKQLQFSVNLPPALPALNGDPHRIGQVIQNLCTNAVQYTKEGGRISIEATVQPGWVIVGVRDTGIGISKEDLPRVWERFFQTKEAQTMRKAGFGLGLKIAREIVQMHGGDMGIESELGVGSFFYFKLPIPKPVAPAPPATPVPPAPPRA